MPWKLFFSFYLRHLTLDRVPVIGHLSEEVWSYFAMGVQLQELYISPDKMSPEAYDVLAEGAKWARLRAESLQYSTWIGGDAVELEVSMTENPL